MADKKSSERLYSKYIVCVFPFHAGVSNSWPEYVMWLLRIRRKSVLSACKAVLLHLYYKNSIYKNTYFVPYFKHWCLRPILDSRHEGCWWPLQSSWQMTSQWETRVKSHIQYWTGGCTCSSWDAEFGLWCSGDRGNTCQPLKETGAKKGNGKTHSHRRDRRHGGRSRQSYQQSTTAWKACIHELKNSLTLRSYPTVALITVGRWMAAAAAGAVEKKMTLIDMKLLNKGW